MDMGGRKINLVHRLSWSCLSDHRAGLDNLKLQISPAMPSGFMGQCLQPQEYPLVSLMLAVVLR